MNIFNFIHILCVSENSPLAQFQGQGGRINPRKGSNTYIYEQLLVTPMNSLCICNDKQLYYLYSINCLLVLLIGMMYKMYANHKCSRVDLRF